MKTVLLSIVLLVTNVLFAQTIPNMDTTKSILLVSHKNCIDKPILNVFKKRQDIILFINVNDKEVYGFVNANYDLYGKITEFNLDSTGHMHVFVDMNDRTNGKTKNKQVKICYSFGNDFFTMVSENKVITHTDIKCEAHKEKIFNVDFN